MTERSCEAVRSGADAKYPCSAEHPGVTDVSRDLAALIEAASDWQVDLLRRRAGDIADALDRAAMRDVEGAKDWRRKEV